MSQRTLDCDDCEGTGDYHRHDPQFDDPYLVTRRYGVPCPTCKGDGFIEVEDEPVSIEDLAALTTQPTEGERG